MNTKTLIAAMVAVTLAAGAQAGSRAEKQAMEAGILKGDINVPAAGGTCGAPTAFTATPYADTGTTIGATNIVGTLAAGCSNYTSVAGPDVVYSFTAGAAANLTFNLTTTSATYDPAIYLLTTCASGAAPSCIIGADAALAGGAETFTTPALTNGTTYFFHVDSFYSTAAGSGPYSLSVTGTLPVQLQDFSID